MDKLLFTLKLHSVIDIITNSSSELFVGKGDSKKEIRELIYSIYPNYLSEYDEIKSIDDLTIEELNMYVEFATGCDFWPTKNKEDYQLIFGFTFDELYEPEEDLAWNNEIQYRLKYNDEYYNFVTENNFEECKNKIDPERKMYFLFSLDDNPDWDMQEKLMNIMNKYHLG